MKKEPFKNLEVAAIFDKYPRGLRTKLMELRQLVFETANKTPGVGKIEETLKWGQPSYLTVNSKSGSTIRIDLTLSKVNEYAIYFHCQTNLISTFKKMYPNDFKFEDNRAIIFSQGNKFSKEKLCHCIGIALTYHITKPNKKSL